MDGRGLGEETCKNMKEVASKYGVQIVCDENDEQELAKAEADVVMPAGEECENTKLVASKVGVVVVCDEEA